MATKTRLGWMVRGVIGHDTRVDSARVHSAFCSPALDDTTKELATAVRGFCDTESFGTEFHNVAMSPEN